MIDLSTTDKWIQICEVEGNELKFTREYLDITGVLGCGARKMAAHLASGWEVTFEGLLDYFGPDDVEEDWYTGIDGDTMDICETIPESLTTKGIPSSNLDEEWHRDIYRAKLITLKIPKRLLEQYVKTIRKDQEK